MPSHRFFRAVQLLVLLHRAGGARLSSMWIAAHLSEQPDYLRRLLLVLARAGPVSCRPGPDGGARLAMNAEQLTLLDVYRASGPGRPFGCRARPAARAGHLACQVDRALAPMLDEATSALENVLARYSLLDIEYEVTRLRQRSGRPPALAGRPAQRMPTCPRTDATSLAAS